MRQLWKKPSFKQAAAGVGSNAVNHHSIVLTRRSGIEIAGAFILIATLLAVAANYRSASHLSHNASQAQPTTTLQVEKSSNTNPSDQSLSQSGSNVSTNVSSTTTDNGTSTNVTVNGQPISVPDNGTVNKTVNTSEGPVSVSASSNHNSVGDSTNLNVSSNHLNVHSSSNTSVSSTSRTEVR